MLKSPSECDVVLKQLELDQKLLITKDKEGNMVSKLFIITNKKGKMVG